MLKLLEALFREWDAASIRFCHWKSNEHLGAALNGDTDLDLLVERSGLARLHETLGRLGCKRFQNEEHLRYTGIEDYIGHDEPSGKLVHLHVHYELVVGKKFIKDRHLPWERLIFDSRRRDPSHGVWIIAPGLELLLLLVRHALKSSWSPKHALRGGRLGGDDRREFDFLKNQIDPSTIESSCRDLDLGSASDRLTRYLAQPRGRGLFRMLERLTRIYGTSSGPALVFRYLARKLRAAGAYFNHRYRRRPMPYRRRLYAGGMIVCFLGIDGSGKSTVIREMTRWLSVKLDPYPVYFGSGGGKSSLLRAPLAWLSKKRSRSRGDVSGLEQRDHERSLKKKRMKFFRFIWAMLLAREKRQKLLAAWRARNRGMIVLADRYPQTQFPGLGDGPLLGDGGTGRNQKASGRAAWKEWERYELAERLRPDLVIKLTVSLATALKRKKDTPAYVLEKKADIVSRLRFSPPTVVVEISTEQPLADTVREAKKAIWDHLYA